MAPQLLLSLVLLPLPQPTQENTPNSEIPLLLYEDASGDCFFGSLGAVSQGQDKQLLSWMNDSHPNFIPKMLQGIVVFGGLFFSQMLHKD